MFLVIGCGVDAVGSVCCLFVPQMEGLTRDEK
jgi:hypothetical protein